MKHPALITTNTEAAHWSEVVSGSAGWCVITGDNAQIMPEIGMVDHVITDPPYDVATHAGAMCGSADKTAAGKQARGVPFAALTDPAALAARLLADSNRWVLAFCALEQLGEYQRGAGPAWVRAGVWDRVTPAPQLRGDRPAQAVEGIAIMHRPGRKRWNGGGTAAIWRHRAVMGDQRPQHPTPKPVGLMLELVELFTDPDDLVLDPFCGSGTTGIACARLGRRFIGIEQKPEWAELSRERIRAEAAGSNYAARSRGQGALFG
jgi:site-specific DNA-methyltransferase (adenine-specific)